MRRTVHISGQIEPFFGTLDENVRLLEDSLRVRTHLHDTRLTIEGEQDCVDQAVKIVEEYNHLTRHGRTLSAAEVKSLMRVATEEPHESPRGMFEHSRVRCSRRSIPICGRCTMRSTTCWTRTSWSASWKRESSKWRRWHSCAVAP